MTTAREAVDDAYRREWATVLAATVRVAGDLDLAEECVQEAFVTALERWDFDGVPDRPGAWLTTTARRKALDQLRRGATLRRKIPLLIEPEEQEEGHEVTVIADDRLRLVFTCCHPALAPETQVALTLRLVCGLPTAAIARTFLVSEATMAARITRGKKKIAIARIPFAMPAERDVQERLDAVLTTIHLFFTAGHTAPGAQELLDREMTRRAIGLARLLDELIPGRAEVQGLLALLLLTDARREARVSSSGDLVLLEDQDRSQWDSGQIVEGERLAARALAGPAPHGRFALQAGIAAVHGRSASWAETDWTLIVQIYDELDLVWPSPVVRLNRAAALAMAEGPEAGLLALDELSGDPALRRYHYLPAARADLLRRLGRDAEAADQYRQALLLVDNEVERRFLQRRLVDVTA